MHMLEVLAPRLSYTSCDLYIAFSTRSHDLAVDMAMSSPTFTSVALVPEAPHKVATKITPGKTNVVVQLVREDEVCSVMYHGDGVMGTLLHLFKG